MFIKEVTWHHRNDFHAVLGCEHCDHEVKITTGYDDQRYHKQVIPAMLCKGCGKNRAGGNETEAPGVGVETH